MEEKLQMELGLLKKSVADEKRRMRAYRKAKNTFVGELKQKQKRGVTVSEVLLYVNFVERLTRDIEKQKEKVAEVEKKLEQGLEDLIEAKKKKKTLEQIKNKKLKEHNHAMLKIEQDFLNEVSTTRFSRQLQHESR
jgi:flagellar export protein FliJ